MESSALDQESLLQTCKLLFLGRLGYTIRDVICTGQLLHAVLKLLPQPYVNKLSVEVVTISLHQEDIEEADGRLTPGIFAFLDMAAGHQLARLHVAYYIVESNEFAVLRSPSP